MTKVVQHLWEASRFENAETIDLVLDRERPIVSTWRRAGLVHGAPCRDAERSHINHCVCDSGWEAEAAAALDRSPQAAAWVKNDHLGFEVLYLYKASCGGFLPDFLIRLTNGPRLVLEVEGEDEDETESTVPTGLAAFRAWGGAHGGRPRRRGRLRRAGSRTSGSGGAGAGQAGLDAARVRDVAHGTAAA
ncbi:MAG: hypothetical protein F4018_07695 [Acidobacteria bacterium]|nr:hypothetical protein [Acidobacteriota bacterium]MYK88226.1 hypothetical protein [Acidobacteriota bacterium]